MRFEDLPTIDDEVIRQTYRTIKVDQLALAFVSAPQEIQAKLFNVTRPVHAQFIKAAMSVLRNPSETAVAAARLEFLRVLDKARSDLQK
ncbi:MAG: hypothetical protein HY928_00720 [Elusimicrobia bacterium]|nr:hypothetical protein [Elusimicrobiota bacterium]